MPSAVMYWPPISPSDVIDVPSVSIAPGKSKVFHCVGAPWAIADADRQTNTAAYRANFMSRIFLHRLRMFVSRMTRTTSIRVPVQVLEGHILIPNPLRQTRDHDV